MQPTWILVAESSQAIIYEAHSRKGPVAMLDTLSHPEGRKHEGDFKSDRSGSDGGSPDLGRHVLDDKTSAKDFDRNEFAKELAKHLDKARTDGKFNSLILTAPPEFLGLLRSNLNKDVASMVVNTVNKNLIQESPDSFIAYL